MSTFRLFVNALITLLALSAAANLSASAQSNSNASSAQATAAAAPCRASEAYRQLDFWVGEWDVQGPKGKTVGASSVQLILNDCVVFENWTGAGGSTGKSFNLYNAQTRKWKQVWVDNQGNMLEFIGEFKDGAMRYSGESIAQNGKPVMDRLTFFPLAEGRVRQLWEQSPDKGKTWNIVFDGTYIRKKQ
ncbi:MAG: hypothetical protein ICV60_13540 [Pyrinomonadaceae bacterium]|nr:hypothetical protein [Pyrinomonadaceae bacterium]